MSQNIEDTNTDAGAESGAASPQDFLKSLRKAKKERIRSGLAAGPSYGSGPLLWFDQCFARDVALAGSIESEFALRVGATQNSLDVAIVASELNKSDLHIPAGATLTLTLLQGDTADGEFEEVGPTICATAPAEGISAGPGCLVFRFALGNMCRPWCKVKLAVAGECGPGTVDIGLAYKAR